MAALLAACPQLRVVANIAVGFNNFDVPALSAAGVLATNTPDVLTETTADFGFALLMATARRITESEHFLRAGQWNRWALDMFAGAEVHGSTLGILGMGRIGQGIARRGALGFGMKVIYHNRSRLSAALEAECKASYVGKEELLRTADHVVLVVPYTPESHHTIGAAELALMKPTATLINIARGGIVELAFGVTLGELVEGYGGGTRSGRPLRAVRRGCPALPPTGPSAARSPPAAPARRPFAIFPAVMPRSPSPATESNSSNLFELCSSAAATVSIDSVNELMLA